MSSFRSSKDPADPILNRIALGDATDVFALCGLFNLKSRMNGRNDVKGPLKSDTRGHK